MEIYIPSQGENIRQYKSLQTCKKRNNKSQQLESEGRHSTGMMNCSNKLQEKMCIFLSLIAFKSRLDAFLEGILYPITTYGFVRGTTGGNVMVCDVQKVRQHDLMVPSSLKLYESITIMEIFTQTIHLDRLQWECQWIKALTSE